jgi:hypothetical protein
VVCLPNDTGSVSAMQAGPDDRVNVRHGTAFSLISWAARPFRPRRRFRWVAGGRMASKQKCIASAVPVQCRCSASATPVQLGIQTGLVCQTEENSAGLWMQQTGKGSQQGIWFTEAAQAWDDGTMRRWGVSRRGAARADGVAYPPVMQLGGPSL